MAKKRFYKRGWHHTKTRGRETHVTCGFCGRVVPKYKTFPISRSFKITDPALIKEIGKKGSIASYKMYACPSCARFHRIVRRKK